MHTYAYLFSLTKQLDLSLFDLGFEEAFPDHPSEHLFVQEMSSSKPLLLGEFSEKHKEGRKVV